MAKTSAAETFVTSPGDVEYVRASFRELDPLCEAWGHDPARVRSEIEARRMPEASYIVSPGIAMFPDDYFVFPMQCGDGDRRSIFLERLASAAASNGIQYSGDDLSETWMHYIDGTYGICLRVVLPESIVRKHALIGMIQSAIERPDPQSAEWLLRLRTAVDGLDALERPFAQFDRDRFRRPVTRDTYVTAVRTRFHLSAPPTRGVR